MLIMFRFTIIVMAVLVALPLFAADKQTTKLKDVMTEISKTSPEIRESVNVYDSLNAELKMAKTGYNPVISAYLSGGKEITDGVDTDNKREDLNATSATISLKQNIFNGSGTVNYVRETEARVMSASYDVLNTANQVFLSTAEAYITVLQEKELLDIALDNVTTQAQILAQIQEKTKSGFGKISDLTNSQARLALSRANYIAQQQNLKQALVKFHRQTGRFLSSDEFEIPDMSYNLPKSAEEMVDIAFVNYPAINVSDYNIVAKKYGKKRVNAQYYPIVDFELKATHNDNTGGDKGSTDIQSAMFSMNYNFYDGGKRGAEKQLRTAEMMKEYERSYIERRNLIESVRLAWNIKEAEELKMPFLKDYVDLTLKTRDAFVEENKLGRRSLTEVLNIENDYNTSKTAITKSKYTIMIAYFRLLQSTGILINEYDKDLAKKVGLPDRIKLNTLEDYGNLDHNRDKDDADDRKDQCQQSMDPKTAPYGCEGSEGINIGYTVPVTFEPYIKPKNGDDSLEALTVIPSGTKTVITEDALGLPEALPTPVKPKPVPPKTSSKRLLDPSQKEQTIVLSGDSFKSGSFELTDEATAEILRIAKELRGLKEPYILKIYGHTDNSQTVEQSKEISKLMVMKVHNRFLELGIPKSAMLGYGKGSSMPVASNDSVISKAKNRRIELKIIK
ncbi:TolC family protein [Seleniivibrio sp.]|uniref:TolC family protein n=1 Tax=Seleniivibrio sp. TaxID=2898801 RepID=UPI0025E9D6C1|nr:TolC family protein [Seleniivibrio sp.]MCD8554607.1 TolC family protein [Seleniivibrio sp.]